MAGKVPLPCCVGFTRRSNTHPSLGPFHETAIHVGRYENKGNCFAIVYSSGLGALDQTQDGVRQCAEEIAVALNAHADLLAACENAVSLWAFQSTDEPQRAWLEETRAAIAKAKGGT